VPPFCCAMVTMRPAMGRDFATQKKILQRQISPRS
jgi:hypothetical protein